MDRQEILSEIKKTEIVIRRNTGGRLSGLYASAYRGTGVEISGLREYYPGDDFRLIDWNATARTGRPHTRVMREERDLDLYIIADISSSMAAGGTLYPPSRTKLETAAVAAAVLGFSAVSGRDRCGAIFFAGDIEEIIALSGGRSHAFAIAEKMLDSEPLLPGSCLEAACASLPWMGGSGKRGICVIISDFEYDVPWKSLLALSSVSETALFRIFDNGSGGFGSYSFDAVDCDPADTGPGRSFRNIDTGIRGGRTGLDWHQRLNSKAEKYPYPGTARKDKVSGNGGGRLFHSSAVPGSKTSSGKNSKASGVSDFGSAASELGIPFAEISTSDNVLDRINRFFKSRAACRRGFGGFSPGGIY